MNRQSFEIDDTDYLVRGVISNVHMDEKGEINTSLFDYRNHEPTLSVFIENKLQNPQVVFGILRKSTHIALFQARIPREVRLSVFQLAPVGNQSHADICGYLTTEKKEFLRENIEEICRRP